MNFEETLASHLTLLEVNFARLGASFKMPVVLKPGTLYQTIWNSKILHCRDVAFSNFVFQTKNQ